MFDFCLVLLVYSVWCLWGVLGLLVALFTLNCLLFTLTCGVLQLDGFGWVLIVLFGLGGGLTILFVGVLEGCCYLFVNFRFCIVLCRCFMIFGLCFSTVLWVFV